MVVGVLAPVLGLALALPTGLLFGLGYGTGVRIGYEQLYPLLFPDKLPRDATQIKQTIIEMNHVYNAIGGKEASQMGMGMGIQAAGELLDNPDFQVLEELESRLSGRTPGKSDLHDKSDKGFLEDSFNPGKYSFEWIQEFITRIPLATRAQLITWRQYLESDPLEKLDQQDIDNLLNFVNAALQSESEKEPGDPGIKVTEKYKATFTALVTELDDTEFQSMYNNRANFYNWQIQIITQEKHRRDDQNLGLRDYDIRRNVYTAEIKRLQTFALSFKNSYAIWKNKSNNAKMKIELKKNTDIVKRIINYITLSRNDLTLKSLANNDWNHQIWKKNRIVE